MNKNECYKKLMLNYTVDTEKVKRMAKRRVVKRSSRVLRIIPGAAACAAVTAAAVTIVSLGTFNNDGGGIDVYTDEYAIARAAAAEQYYVNVPVDSEIMMDMYVSFEQGMSYNEMLLAFSKIDDDGDIKIKLLYDAKGKCYEYTDSISADDLVLLGVKISAPASMCMDIRLLNTVSLVELPESGITDDGFVPFGSSVAVTTTEATGNSFEVSIPSYSNTEGSSASQEPTTTSPAEPTETDNTTDGTTDVTSNEPEVTDTETGEVTSPELAPEIEIPVAGITTVNIISADRIVVTTGDSIRLYRLEEDNLALETTFYASNAKVSWKSYDGSVLYITACDNVARNRLYLADGKTGTLTELDVSAITADGAEISSVVGASNGVTLFKTVTSEKSRIYAVHPMENALSINLVIEYDGPVTSLALLGNQLYYAYTDTRSSTVGIAVKNLADGSVTEVTAYSGTLRSTRSLSLTSAALTFTTEDKETCVLLTPDGTLVETELSNISFSRTSGRIFTDGENYYYLGSDGPAAMESTEQAIAAFAPSPAPGSYTAVIQEDGSAYLMLKAE